MQYPLGAGAGAGFSVCHRISFHQFNNYDNTLDISLPTDFLSDTSTKDTFNNHYTDERNTNVTAYRFTNATNSKSLSCPCTRAYILTTCDSDHATYIVPLYIVFMSLNVAT